MMMSRMSILTPCVLLVSLFCVCSSYGESFPVMTFNIRYDNPADGANQWPNRAHLVLETIATVQPAALAIQEALPHQLQRVLNRFPSFRPVGETRSGDGQGEFSGLLIDVSVLEVLDSGQVWLSPTPAEVGSVGWDAALTRTATWVMLRRCGSTGPAFLIVGTHFDHRGEMARVKSAELIVEQIPLWTNGKKVPVLIMGDLNATPQSDCLGVFADAGFAPIIETEAGTFHRFSGAVDGPRIDYILRNARWHIEGSDILRAADGASTASDHDAVAARVRPISARGTIGRTRQLKTVWHAPSSQLLDLAALSLPEDIIQHAHRTAGVLESRGRSETDHHQLSWVRAGFAYPFALPEIAMDLTDAVAGLAQTPSNIRQLAGYAIDASPRRGERPQGDIRAAEQVLALLAVPADTFYIQDESIGLVDVINRSMDVDFDAIVQSIRVPEATKPPVLGHAKPPGVQGTILGAEQGLNGWRVVGGDGPNIYDMAVIAEVFDIGGNDQYTASDLVIGDRLVIDFAGNDAYTGTDRQGPAAGLFGTWIIDDRAGNDRYGTVGGKFSTAAGAFGVGMIVDRGGNDVYMGTQWSIGAAVYGAGIILDLGDGSDQYLGDYLTDAVGGPRGFGFVFDEAGDDLHVADGPTPSVYGTANVHAALSQGIGFGYRKYAAGGIGLLCDLAGDDVYQAGEFSQGGGYYHSLGVLRDYEGNDVYRGNRYAQGFGVHQAFGVLLEDGGDDMYSAMTAADQGSAWDIAAGALVERGGNDSYAAGGMAQASAAQQAIAYLIECAGDDTYQTIRPGQGGSGSNTYHWDGTRAFSFSLLNDRAGDDTYSLGRKNGEITVTNPDPEAKGSGVGVCVDTDSIESLSAQ
jgi:endonuclease/exonuclease/phosphatase family metal-dependent hydrolase